jgi:hypothetical protein
MPKNKLALAKSAVNTKSTLISPDAARLARNADPLATPMHWTLVQLDVVVRMADS